MSKPRRECGSCQHWHKMRIGLGRGLCERLDCFGKAQDGANCKYWKGRSRKKMTNENIETYALFLLGLEEAKVKKEEVLATGRCLRGTFKQFAVQDGPDFSLSKNVAIIGDEDGERLLTHSADMLLLPPAYYNIGFGAAIINNDAMSYVGSVRLDAKPKGVFCVDPKATIVGICASRIGEDLVPFGTSSCFMGFNLAKPWMPKPCRGRYGQAENDLINRRACVAHASIIEDVFCRWNAEIKVGERSIHIGSDWDGIQELLALREGPTTGSGKRKAIVHWVAKHVRERRNGDKSAVSGHLRGIESFELDGLRIKTCPPMSLVAENINSAQNKLGECPALYFGALFALKKDQLNRVREKEQV